MPKRAHDELRPIRITPHFLAHPEGSALIEWGDTKVLCTASIDTKLPSWLQGKQRGWVTAEYDMLPRATHSRKARDSHRGKINGRTQEISRLIARALRAGIDLKALGEQLITIDCDVIQADGGTRTAAITGGWVALALAVQHLQTQGLCKNNPLLAPITAVSVGLIDDTVQLDLDYHLDSNADADVNIVMTAAGDFVEIQGTAERTAFNRDQMNMIFDRALGALPTLVNLQQRAAATPLGPERITLQA